MIANIEMAVPRTAAASDVDQMEFGTVVLQNILA
jgi:hypothetical protein